VPQRVGVKGGDAQVVGELTADVLGAGHGQPVEVVFLLAGRQLMNRVGEWSVRAFR
jgi:hypothetical protein